MAPLRALFLVLVLGVPAALASWSPSPSGQIEPSTPYDDPTLLWFNASRDPHGERIYFSGELSPVGMAPTARRFVAWLGYWKDCNGDGYIGSLAGEVYASELLDNDAICPFGTARHQGGVVKEFLWIGPGSRDVDDPGALVWGDWGLPGAHPPAGFGLKSAADEVLTFDADAEGPKWSGSTFWVSSTYGDLRPGESTLYASVSPTLSGTLPGGSGVYGAGACPGAAGGWQCDPALWAGPVKVDQAYQLRDVDCHDVSKPGGAC